MHTGYPIGLYRGLLLPIMFFGLLLNLAYGYTVIMNELYNETIERRGKIYHYDPDTDTYYQRHASHRFWDKYAWIIVVILLTIACYCIEFKQ